LNANTAQLLIAEDHSASPAATEHHIANVLLNDACTVGDKALLGGREVVRTILKRQDIVVVDKRQLAALVGVVVLGLKGSAISLTFGADLGVAEHEVDFLRLLCDLVLEKDAADFASLVVERRVRWNEGDLLVEGEIRGEGNSDLLV